MLGGCIFHYYWSKLVISNNTNKEDKVENVSANKKKAIVITSHKKRKVVRSEAQALSQLAGGMNKLIESKAELHKEHMEFEKERDRAFLEFKREEAVKNRRHELEIAKIFASSMNNSQQQGDFRCTPFNQTSLSTFDSTRCKFSTFYKSHVTFYITTDFTSSASSCKHILLDNSQFKIKLKHQINPFQANFFFLYPLKTSEN